RDSQHSAHPRSLFSSDAAGAEAMLEIKRVAGNPHVTEVVGRNGSLRKMGGFLSRISELNPAADLRELPQPVRALARQCAELESPRPVVVAVAGPIHPPFGADAED